MIVNMSKLYQYLVNDIVNISDWLDKNSFDSSSFKKVIVESVEKVKEFGDLDSALNEKIIIKIRFFNKDYEFNVVRDKKGKLNIFILTEKVLPYKKQAYIVIEPQDDINIYNYRNNSEFTIKKYICEPIVMSKFNNPNFLSMPELLVFYRIYG